MSRALRVTDNPPMPRIDWRLEVVADASADILDGLKRLFDGHCPGAYCIRNRAIDLHTSFEATR